MRHQKAKLFILLAITVVLLSGCYVDTEDPTTGRNQVTGGNSLPFDTIRPTDTPKPSPTPTPETIIVGGNNISNIDWDAGNVTMPPSGGSVVTMPPSLGTSNPGGTQPTATRTASTSVTAEPESSTLRAGSKGEAVKQAQQRLKDLKYYTGSVDGSYGAATTAAVKEFQAANNLTVDGVIGAKTKESLYSRYAKTYSGTPSVVTAKPGSTPTPKPTATPNLTKARYLKIGMSGTDVRQVQTRLIELGYMAGKADGSYGTATEMAVKEFQKRNKLWYDGIAGPETQQKLFSSSAVRASGSPFSYVGATLEMGAEGDAVRALQNRLIQLKYLTGSADGSYGAKTKSAVEAFQRNNGLTADGKAGQATLAKLFSDSAVNANGVAPTSSASSGSGAGNGSSTGYTVLQPGDKGDAVKRLQQRLKDLKFYTGSVDGSFGQGTEEAVCAFQRAMNLVVDGKAGPATQRALYGVNAEPGNTSATLEIGSEGAAVTSLQYALYELGYYQDKINGVYTTNTANAVREFQMNNGLTADGKAGKLTLEKLYSPYAKPVTVETPQYVTVRRGDENEDVQQVNNALFKLGYTQTRGGRLFDDTTYNALVLFQQRNGLTADGVAGAATQAVLFSSGAVRAP